MKKDWVAYLLAAFSVLGCAGLHRFYLGRPVSGVLYLVTWGWFGLGTLHDFIRMRSLINRANAEQLGAQPQTLHLHIHGMADPESVRLAAMKGMAMLSGSSTPAPEQTQAELEGAILRSAQAHGGTVTAALVALEASLSLDQAQNELRRLHQAGFCSVDVSVDGAEIFTFAGLGSTSPLVS
jgi:TM2 domain-containing membrane protein YozV